MRTRTFLSIGAAALIAGCSKTPNGDVVIQRPGEVDVKTTQDTLHLPSIGTTKDTVSTPVIGVEKETLIVNKPVIGAKKTEITRPTVRRP